MTKYRRNARIDNNQNDIVEALRQIPGVTVQVGMDDILVGRSGLNYWFEIKDTETVSKKTGQVIQSKIKDSQEKLITEWRGQYSIVWNLDQILTEIGLAS